LAIGDLLFGVARSFLNSQSKILNHQSQIGFPKYRLPRSVRQPPSPPFLRENFAGRFCPSPSAFTAAMRALMYPKRRAKAADAFAIGYWLSAIAIWCGAFFPQ
jgi:hypothetical protein